MRKPVSVLPFLILGALVAPACGSDGAPATVQNPGTGQSGAAGAAGAFGAAGKSGAAGASGKAGASGAGAAGVAGNAGTAGAAGSAPGACKVDADCTPLLPVTSPAECAEGKCEAGTCVFVAKDKDGDKHAAKICASTDSTKTVKLGDDCNDADPNTFPGAWDGPGDGVKPNRCNDGVDQNCSGADGDNVASNGQSCACTPGDTSECDEDASGKPLDLPSGPITGVCKRGSKICVVDPNTGGGKFGVCVGGVGRGNELCDNKDNDCNGTVDDVDKVPDAFTWFYDGDLDTRGSAAIKPVQACFKPTAPPAECASAAACAGKTPAECCPPERWKTGNVAADDCDDFNLAVSPLAVERCNDGVDNNCNGATDEPESSDAVLFYWDGDHDSFASAAYAPVKACSQQTPKAPPSECPDCNGGSGDVCTNTVGNTSGPCWKAGLPPSDCNDADAARYPGAIDKCDNTDFDCDGSPNTACACTDGGTPEACGSADTCNAGTRKCEGGKFTACSGGAATTKREYCADLDVDFYCDLSKCEIVCDAAKKPGYRLKESCYGINEGRTDCDEKSSKASSINPGAVELCGDNLDNDCDGSVDEDGASGSKLFFLDADGDNYGDKTVAPRNSCKSPGTGWKENIPNTDCRDKGTGQPPPNQVNPGAKDLCDNLDRDCNGTPNTGCACTNGQTQSCGSTQTCNAGTITCVNGAWSQCAQPSAQREYCPDKDNDGFCVLTGCAFFCTNGVAPTVPSGYRERVGCGVVADCNDDSLLARPGGPNEATAAAGALYCDGLDNDCNGLKDDGNACKDQVCFPAGSDLKAWPAGHLPNAGDQDTAGEGPRMTISWEYAPQLDGTLGFTKGKVDAWETRADGTHGDGTRGNVTDLRVRKATSKSGKLVTAIWGQGAGVVKVGGCTYRDNSNAQDLPSCPGISAVCYGDTQDSDVCEGNECVVAAFGDYAGCILTPTCVDVQVKP